MKYRVAGPLLVLLLGATCLVPLPVAVSNETVDPTVTGSINANASIPKVVPQASAGFSTALELLDNGNAAEAYASAKGLANNAERRAIQWAAIYFNAGKIDSDSIERFAKDAPDFSSPGLYQTRIEQSLTTESPTAENVIKHLGGVVPNTIDGQIALASAYLEAGQTERAAKLTRSIWVDNYLTGAQESEVLSDLGGLLDRDAHWARAVHLMMNDRASGSERLMPFLSAAQQSLVVARAAVSRNDANAKALLDKVDPSLQTNPVYIFREYNARDRLDFSTARWTGWPRQLANCRTLRTGGMSGAPYCVRH
ncbi:hypothetical protein PSQ19_01825 [Devosia algicola]|uniref:Uncharacterized protein n=1 Tax=Devosia algicola TaxID=3026418 RepID=A0ABY7YP71_9HYPH|nr:hypothetical protein [Devosia algicola]WDR02982.1 hypothetical protein PSQ19_01825 [Devosia algicola]